MLQSMTAELLLERVAQNINLLKLIPRKTYASHKIFLTQLIPSLKRQKQDLKRGNEIMKGNNGRERTKMKMEMEMEMK